MRQDRFLLALLIAVLALVLVSLGLYAAQRSARDYGPEDEPAGVVRNYLLALQNQDYERAYAYLVEANARPSFEDFQRAFIISSSDLYELAVQVGETEVVGREAAVNLVLIDHGSGPLSDVFREATQATLERDAQGAWKLTYLPYPYWGFNWYLEGR
jgi:hypothetical protein